MSETFDNTQIHAGTIAKEPVGIESRVARLEAAMDYVVRELADLRRVQERGFDRQERDFRLLFSMIVATNIGLAGLMAKGFGWL